MDVRSSAVRRAVALLSIVGTVAICPIRAEAQVIRGTLQASKDASGAGVSGAVVQLLDSAGNALGARTLSDARGAFTLAAPLPGRYLIRARRIGFRPVTSALLSIVRDTSVALTMADIPVRLPAITALERTECRLRPDSGLALAALWEETKTALLAAEITRESSPYTFDLVNHARSYDFSPGELLSVSLDESNEYTTRSWASVPPENLRRDGYVRFGVDSTAFIAPDIQTLLSTYFTDTHCLRIGAHPYAPDSLVGIDFDPAEKIEHVEIRGTFWLNRRSHALTAIDFHYVNLDLGAADTAAGGHVEFAPLASGAWILTDWTIRIPLVHVAVDHQVHPTGNPSFRRRMRFPPTILEARNRIVPDQLRVAGGTLRSVVQDSTPVWSQPKREITVHVTTGPSRQPFGAGRAFGNLVGTPRWVHTDSAGTMFFNDLVHGSYLVDVSTGELDLLGWPRQRIRVDLGAGPSEVAEVQLASALEAARAVCDDDAKSLNDLTGVVIGRVTAGERPIAGRAVTLSWPDQTNGGKRVSRTVRTLSGDGRYIVCGVPRERDVAVHVEGQDAARDKTARITRDRVVAVVDMPVGS